MLDRQREAQAAEADLAAAQGRLAQVRQLPHCAECRRLPLAAGTVGGMPVISGPQVARNILTTVGSFDGRPGHYGHYPLLAHMYRYAAHYAPLRMDD